MRGSPGSGDTIDERGLNPGFRASVVLPESHPNGTNDVLNFGIGEEGHVEKTDVLGDMVMQTARRRRLINRFAVGFMVTQMIVADGTEAWLRGCVQAAQGAEPACGTSERWGR